MTAESSVLAAMAESTHVTRLGGGELVTLPFAVSNGNLVQVYVEQTGEDDWLVTDQGQAAGELAIAGVNLSTQKSATRSWDALLRSLPVSVPVLIDVPPFELAGTAPTEHLGRAILAVGEAVVRAEGLRALASNYRPRTFRDTIVKAASIRNLAVEVGAKIPTRHGGSRSVSLSVEGNHRVYMQAISGSQSALDSFDKAQAVLSSAQMPAGSLVPVLASRVRLVEWQWASLRDFGTPITEAELPAYMDALAS